MRRELLESYLANPLRVLAMWQPWGILAVAPDPAHDGEPPKRHETRHWYPYEPLPLRVAIHATAGFGREQRETLKEPRIAEALRRCGYHPADPRPLLKRGTGPVGKLRPMPLGAIVGVATVIGIYSVHTPSVPAINAGVQWLNPETISADDAAMGYFVRRQGDPHPHRYAWRLADTVLFPEPVPHTGRQDPLYELVGAEKSGVTIQLMQLLETTTATDGRPEHVSAL